MQKSLFEKVIYSLVGLFAIVGIASNVYMATKPSPQNSPIAIGTVGDQSVYYSGFTNATTSIGRASATTVFSGTAFSVYARITNTTQNDISCYVQSATAASSTVVVGAGIPIGRAATTTFSGESSVCFGAAAGCIPYVGQINCIASVTTTVALISK